MEGKDSVMIIDMKGTDSVVIINKDKFLLTSMQSVIDLAVKSKLVLFGGAVRDLLTDTIPTDLDFYTASRANITNFKETAACFFDVEKIKKSDYGSSIMLLSKFNKEIKFKIDFTVNSNFIKGKNIDFDVNSLIYTDKNNIKTKNDKDNIFDILKNIREKKLIVTADLNKPGCEPHKIQARLCKMLSRGWTLKNQTIEELFKDENMIVKNSTPCECNSCKTLINDTYVIVSKCCGKSYHSNCFIDKKINICTSCNKYF